MSADRLQSVEQVGDALSLAFVNQVVEAVNLLRDMEVRVEPAGKSRLEVSGTNVVLIISAAEIAQNLPPQR